MREGLACVLSVKVRTSSAARPGQAGLQRSAPGRRKAVARTLETWLLEHRTTPRRCAPRSSRPPAPAKPRARREMTRRKSVLKAPACPASWPTARKRPGAVRAVHRRGRLRRRLGQAGRDRKFQAILPLRGKVLNVEKARFDRLIASEQIATLITALGTSIGPDFNVDKLRYRLIIMTDADVDGAHPHPAADAAVPPDARAGAARLRTSPSRRCTRSRSAAKSAT